MKTNGVALLLIIEDNTHTFDDRGTYTYKVSGFEERMKGTIIVK